MHLALVLETEGFQFLIDTRDLWRPEWVLVRRGPRCAEVWLQEPVRFVRPPDFVGADRKRVLELVRAHADDLLYSWCSLKDDVRKGRLDEYNELVD